jgi:RNA 3'-terminal phosphate cyclase-like protein
VLISLRSLQPVSITLVGLTNTLHDESVDAFRAVTIPLLKECGFTASMTSKQREVGPEGKAAVQLMLESPRAIEKPIKLTEEGLVRRIRGVAWTVNMSPQHATLAFSSAKGVLLKLLADVQIFTDVVKSRPSKV